MRRGGAQGWRNTGSMRWQKPAGSSVCTNSDSNCVHWLLTQASVNTSSVCRLAATAFSMLTRLGTPTANDSRSVQTARPSDFRRGASQPNTHSASVWL